MSDPRYAHQYHPRRKDGHCKFIVGGEHCGLMEDAEVHKNWLRKDQEKEEEARWLREETLEEKEAYDEPSITKFLPGMVVGWSILYVVLIILWVVGFIIVPILAITKSWKLDYRFGRVVYVWKYKWAHLWGEDEFGLTGPTEASTPNAQRWCDKAKNWSKVHRAISWCLRNPVGNERFSKLGVYLDSSKMEWIGNCGELPLDPTGNNPRNTGNPWTSWKIQGNRSWWIIAKQGWWRVGFWRISPEGTTSRFGTKIFPGYTRDIDRLQGLICLQPWRRL